MATESVSSLPERLVKQRRLHPLAPLTAEEIKAAAAIIRSVWPTGTDLQFKNITLEEPAKAEVVPYLDAEHAGSPLPSGIRRKAFINYYIRNTNKFHEATVDLTSRSVESNVRLGPNLHANADGDEIVAIEKIAIEDPKVKAEVAKLQLPKGAVVVCDPWIYGSDGINDDERLFQCFLYMRDPLNPNELDSNHYALPLPVSPVISADTFEVIRIDTLPTGADNTLKPFGPVKIYPANEYIPEAQNLRTDIKPLQVVQPEGASFTVEHQGPSTVINWQKWNFRVGFNQREGMVLYDVRYDGRSLFYRLSLSDMNIPYADPRHPYHKKSAFDLGDTGAGMMANNLKLGCDCLGSIYYLDSILSDDKGGTIDMPNVVCIHEQDAGIGWKHTNFRTGRAAVVRQRELVLQSIITVANYEYILAFQFNQAAELMYEVRATGILSTQPIDEGLTVPWGTVVHPGVLAAHHQHIFSLRIDPAIEGHSNRLVYSEALPMPRSDFNPHGTGYYTTEVPVTSSTGLDLNTATNRVFKIQNAAVRNPVNGLPVAYKIMAPDFQKMISDEQSFNHRRAEFADHNIYLVKHDATVPPLRADLFAGGLYTNQSRGGTGVRSWAGRAEPTLDTDILLFVQFGINHVPRIEDFPVMPCEILKVALKPVNFFDRNPALDVPQSEQRFNQSTALASQHQQPAVQGSVGKAGAPQDAACCAPGSKL
ncbi:copper amine oxidase [Phyllosticta citrichinensis]|uniref:Amine oxidase n=1 Tax=Phyllosticta citrichinensis TaxID=1130410 RepID=A0ABR1XXR0_9PEZI